MKKAGVLLFLLLPLWGFAQAPHVILASFSAYKQPNGVLLRWVIKGGSQCNGTKVFRQNEVGVFEPINHIPGICGSATENETYQFFDEEPFPNAYNHYKLEMGFQGFSATITVFFEDFGSANHAVLSDYQANSYRILFQNELNRQATLQLYDQMGRAVYTRTATDSDIAIDANSLQPGVYIYRVTGVSEQKITGKFYLSDR